MNRHKGYFITLSLVIFCVIFFPKRTYPQELSPSEIIEKTWPSVVMISVYDKDDNGSAGTGFFISPKRILTCEHVIRDARYVTIRFDLDLDSKWIFSDHITIMKSDPDSDLGLLEVDPQNQSYLSLADNYEYRPGQPVYTVGFPLGGEKRASEGIISSKLLDDKGFGFTAPVSSGNSGSPVLSHGGSVVGVTYSSDDEGQNLNFSVSIQAIQEFLSMPDSPHKLGTQSNDDTKDSAPLAAAVLKKAKKIGSDVTNFIVFTGRGIFFTVVDISLLLLVLFFIITASEAIFRSFKTGRYKEQLKKPLLVLLSFSALMMWIILGVAIYNLLVPLVGEDSFVRPAAVGTSVIIGTVFYFLLKKVWKRHLDAAKSV